VKDRVEEIGIEDIKREKLKEERWGGGDTVGQQGSGETDGTANTSI
jgi:hypothetical protein